GHYLYADYCAGWIRSFRYDGTAATDQRELVAGGAGNILSFGQDAAGEVYVLSSNGRVYRIEPAEEGGGAATCTGGRALLPAPARFASEIVPASHGVAP